MSVESDIRSLKIQVERLQRKRPKRMSAVLTPYPISNYISGNDLSGNVLHYMFCATGKISKGLIRISELSKGAILEITIKSDLGDESKSYHMKKSTLIIEPDLEVYSSNRLIVNITSNDIEEKITEVWTSFLWTPSVKEADIRNFLITELEELNA